MDKIFNFWNQIFFEIGVKKFWLSFHYILAIVTSLSFFVMCIICTFIPQIIDVGALMNIYKIIMIYCGVVIAYITILSIFDKLQTMHNENTKFDWIAFYIGFCLFVTLALIITCVIFMFKHDFNETYIKMWQFLIGVFGSMFLGEALGGYLYKGFKNKYLSNINTDNVENASTNGGVIEEEKNEN